MGTVVSISYGDKLFYVDHYSGEFVNIPEESIERYNVLIHMHPTPEQKKLFGIPLDDLEGDKKKLMEEYYAARRELKKIENEIIKVDFDSELGKQMQARC